MVLKNYQIKGYRLATKTVKNLAEIKKETGLSYNMLFTNFINYHMNIKSTGREGGVEWEKIKEGEECTYCRTGNIVSKSGKYGNFWACSNFPGCGFTQTIKHKK